MTIALIDLELGAARRGVSWAIGMWAALSIVDPTFVLIGGSIVRR